jgi:hypothetical protein
MISNLGINVRRDIVLGKILQAKPGQVLKATMNERIGRLDTTILTFVDAADLNISARSM